jgi:hypothetical protein
VQFVDTPLVRNMIAKTPEVAAAMMADIGGPLLRPQQVRQRPAGACWWARCGRGRARG